MSTEAIGNAKSYGKGKAPAKEKAKKSAQTTTSVERLKAVVRRLPPNLPENVFWQSVQSWVTDDTVTWKIYCPGKFRKRRVASNQSLQPVSHDGRPLLPFRRLNKENIPSRAYIAFKRDDQLASFAREYDGHLFRDKAGKRAISISRYSKVQG